MPKDKEIRDNRDRQAWKFTRAKAWDHIDAQKFFPSVNNAFEAFVSALPDDGNSNELNYYIQKSDGLNARLAEEQRYIDALRTAAADKSKPYVAVVDALHYAVARQKEYIERFYRQAKQNIEAKETSEEFTLELKQQLLGQLNTRCEHDLATFEKEAVQKLNQTHQQAAREKLMLQEYYRSYILSLQDEETLKQLQQLQPEEQADDSQPGVWQDDEGFKLKGINLGDLDNIPLKSSTGHRLQPDGEGGYTLVKSNFFLADMWYRWRDHLYPDMLSIATLIAAKNPGGTIEWTVDRAKGDDWKKNDAAELRTAKAMYEASIEAGFKPEDIKITMADGTIYGNAPSTEKDNKKQRSFALLFGNDRKIQAGKTERAGAAGHQTLQKVTRRAERRRERRHQDVLGIGKDVKSTQEYRHAKQELIKEHQEKMHQIQESPESPNPMA